MSQESEQAQEAWVSKSLERDGIYYGQGPYLTGIKEYKAALKMYCLVFVE